MLEMIDDFMTMELEANLKVEHLSKGFEVGHVWKETSMHVRVSSIVLAQDDDVATIEES
jgi:hypothetical protein